MQQSLVWTIYIFACCLLFLFPYCHILKSKTPAPTHASTRVRVRVCMCLCEYVFLWPRGPQAKNFLVILLIGFSSIFYPALGSCYLRQLLIRWNFFKLSLLDPHYKLTIRLSTKPYSRLGRPCECSMLIQKKFCPLQSIWRKNSIIIRAEVIKWRQVN